jgi:hypothetical protein
MLSKVGGHSKKNIKIRGPSCESRGFCFDFPENQKLRLLARFSIQRSQAAAANP